jgi:hypothetical protein
MRFALLGDHPDGLDVARALAASGRHQVTVYSGSAVGLEQLHRWGLFPAAVGDLEEVLADPAVEALIVAGGPGDRPAQLRRALQSERHVLCVHPADQTPDIAYEAVLIQKDTGCVLLPLLPEALHPGILRLAQLARNDGGGPSTQLKAGLPPTWPAPATRNEQEASSPLRLLEVERWSSEVVLLDADVPGHRPALPGWDVLRRLGGEIVEVSAFAAGDETTSEDVLLLAGRFERGGLFRVTLVPKQFEARWRLTLLAGYNRAELLFSQGWPGPARLSWLDENGNECEETWDAWDPWPTLVSVFEAALARDGSAGSLLSWQDEVRCLELDDAARRSIARRRTSILEYQTTTEEVSFKGAMTLFGCSLLWASLVLLILSVWVPWLGWLIIPLLVLFLLLQLLRWLLPGQGEESARLPGDPAAR